ncbi:MAG: M1 family peptidase [Chloracidobacterium sp.]|nr:M1 family peptidase [Chloracidobacterium sp.]
MIKRFAHLAFALFLWAQFAQFASADDYPRNSALDAIHYRLSLTIKDASDEIQAEAEVLFEFKQDGVKTIPLDLVGLTVDRVTEDQREAKFTHAGGKLSVALSGDYHRGDRIRITVKYHGRPDDGLIIRKNKFGDFAVFGDNWPDRARHWFPSIDHPYDKATVEFLVTAPARLDVIANGRLIEKTSLQNGYTLTHWSEATPISTYCMVIGATEFSIIDVGTLERAGGDVGLFYYLFPKDRDNGLKGYGRMKQIVEFFSNLIGPYPYEKLALVQSSTRYGGMENSSSIFLAESLFSEDTNAHEIAHQWFGDSVTEADWRHLWLSEGFATYFGHLFFERADGRDKFIRLMRADKEEYIKSYKSQGAAAPPIYDPSITDLMKLLNANNYQKGGWTLHMLRHVMGDEKFFAGVRDYYQTYRDRNALTDDLRKVMEFHYGRPLDWFFKQWIFEPGYPVYDASWSWNEAAKELKLRIAQKQSPTLFSMPLDVEFKIGGATRREIIRDSEREQTFSFKLDARPKSVAIDPDEWVLKVLTINEGKRT